MSISVLPVETKAYQPSNGILSAFYIEPYINGNLENGNYYFCDKIKKRRRNYDLDLLLLTQGWSKYSWGNIFINTPKEYFEPEKGFTILGKINNWNEKNEKQALLMSKESSLFAVVNIKNDGTFKLENIFLEDSSSVAVSLLHKNNGKLSKPPIYLRLLPAKDNQNTTGLSEDFEYEKMKLFPAVASMKIPQNFLKGTVALDAVLLESEKKKPETTSYVGFGAELTMVNEDLANSFVYVTTFLRTKGFIVIERAGKVTIYNRRAVSFNGPVSPSIFVNGFELVDNTRLLYMQTRDLKSIIINKSGAGLGISGSGGAIKLQMKTDYSARNNRETTSFTIANNGFAPTKEFYAPKYTSYTAPAFQDYGTIGWIPNFTLEENGNAILKVFNTLQPKINLYIEGMTSEGALISEIITVETTNVP